ncbi:receptor-type tyrosine-protein phosphatase beta-like [Protopterus annectens]|uniref:receptor-type tyrosine-protein phosphatase beta-like n=1 Tax=Protopterus annectens TaxID=7888 RepID=UPI001CF9AA64|nr:receptor-type tyrosine-protein phosphatase beta-like [Protopterus annectens]
MSVMTDSATITGLTPGGSYNVSISAVSLDNITTGDSVVTSSSTRPEKITNLSVTNNSTNTLFLTWTAPSGLHSYYIVNAVNISGNSLTNMSVMSESAIITGLTPGGSYNVSISAVSLDNTTTGDSVVTSRFTRPEKITNLSVRNNSTNTLFLTWTAPSGLQSYYIVNAVNISGNLLTNMIVMTDSATITGLTPGGSYNVSVSAVSWDNTTTGDSVVTSSSTRPEKITNLSVRNNSTNTLFLTWTAPSGLHSYYIVNAVNISGNLLTNMTVMSDSATITGLTAGGYYNVSISAVSWDNTTTGDSVVTSSSTRPEKITNLSVRNNSTNTLFLTWTAPSGLHNYYILNAVNINGSSLSNMSVMTDSATITGLTPGGSYNVSISAVSWDNTTTGDSVVTSSSTSKCF